MTILLEYKGIVNHEQVRSSGYFTRKLSMLLMDTKLAKDVDDCGSNETNYLQIFIKDNFILSLFEKRYYVDDDGSLKLIDTNNKNLIGKTLKIPSPITCACNHGICKKCYGELFKTNKDMNIGIIAVLILTDPITQTLLSAKHHLEARSSKVEWGDTFKEYFIINRNMIYFDYAKYSNGIIKIYDDDINDEDETSSPTFTKFTLIINKKEIIIESPEELMLNDQIQENMHDYFNNEEQAYEINLNDFSDSTYIFYFVMENNELVQPLFKIKGLVETNSFIKDHTINEIMNYFLELIEQAGIYIQSVHLELIIRAMIDISDKSRKKFKEENFTDYEINRVSEAILKSKSIVRSLLFEQVKKQLTTLDYDTYNKKDKSILDNLI